MQHWSAAAVLRWSAAIVGVTLLLLARFGSTSAGGSDAIRPAAITTSAPVVRLAADGTTVAAVTGSAKSECGEHTLIWNVRRKTPVVMQGKGDSNDQSSSCGNTDLSIAVGGGMVGVLRFDVAHEIESVLSITRIPTDGRWTAITGAFEYGYGAGDGDYLSVLGDGRILAFNRWTVCYVYNAGDTCPGVSADGWWWVSDAQLVEVRPPGSKGAALCPRTNGSGDRYPVPPRIARLTACRQIGRGADYYPAVALVHDRFLTLPVHDQVTIINASNGSMTKLPIPARTVRQAELDGSNLLILRRKSAGIFVLDVRDAATGVLRRTWPLSRVPVKASSIRLEDAHAGIAVYRTGTTIHLLRVSDGKSHAIVIPANHGPVHARLEDPGLVYSFRLPGTQSRGRIEFVPFAHFLAKLR